MYEYNNKLSLLENMFREQLFKINKGYLRLTPEEITLLEKIAKRVS